ncbi:ABC transporter ATP-binding protein [Lederbergia sp. NSJ-179]|uniref:ABC transporter ATP-binding protein n=1 Tax=Lederbergia sp. NSJ-179 TaxID=2931402 RepID=UPI001FD54DC5|nr:ABC transporter ATP-binding protein [Lederbergia sp. NSJ-179]MCJ7840872.1 ABC transporter ATP-binding protein [Lederbergia sp. NSJ-179]
MTDPLLQVENLTIKQGENIIVNHITFPIYKNEIFCLVGESGSGKSITSRAIMGLLNKNRFKVEGNILLNKAKPIELTKQTKREWQKIRGEEIALIYQNPTLALHPLLKIGTQMVDTLRSRRMLSKKKALEEVHKQLSLMNFSDPIKIANSFPSQLSGGMNQRVMICMSLLLQPALLIADEPTTGLDTINQKKIIKILVELKETYKMSILFITHDLRIVSQIADRVAVMKDGEFVEVEPLSVILERPHHPYTEELWKQASTFFRKEGFHVSRTP